MKRAAYVAASLAVLAGLSGCQSVQHAVNTFNLLPADSPFNTDAAYISCAANMGCEFARVDDIPAISETTHLPTTQALGRGILRLENSLFSKQHHYAVSIPAGLHEMKIRFYPVSRERAETFHIIHHFMAGQRYSLLMYRQKKNSGGSLLNVAMPGDLCVDLMQEDVVLRRFCRPFDAVTGMGEFVEQTQESTP